MKKRLARLDVAKRVDRINRICGSKGSRVKMSQSDYRSIGLQVESSLLVFFKQIFFFFQLQKQINDNLLRENE